MNKINDTLKKLTPNSKDALKDKVFNHREVTRPAAKRTKTKRYESDDEDDADDEVLDFAIALSPGSYVAIRDYSNDDLTFAIIKLLDTNPVQLAETELYCYELSDSAGNALCFLPGDECVVGYWCARKHVARGGYQVIDGEKNKFGESEQWDGYPHLYFPKSLILHSGFHMTPYFGTGRSKECVQLSVADRDTILGRIVD